MSTIEYKESRSGIGIGFVAGLVITLVALPFSGNGGADEREDMAACIERLAEYQNALPPRIYGWTEFRYDPDSGRCLYRTSFVDTDNGYHFEKLIADAMTGETLTRYAELDGKPVIGALDDYTEVLDRFFVNPVPRSTMK
jgi:hypothetical protein